MAEITGGRINLMACFAEELFIACKSPVIPKPVRGDGDLPVAERMQRYVSIRLGLFFFIPRPVQRKCPATRRPHLSSSTYK